MSAPMFKHVEDGGKYSHPWMKALPSGRAKTYDLLYKITSTVLFSGAVYGMFEVARGTYYILSTNQEAAAAASKPKDSSS